MSDDYDPEAERFEDAQRLIGRIAADYEALVEQIGAEMARDMLTELAERHMPTPTPRRKGLHNVAFSVALLLAHSEAPSGRKMQAMRRVAREFGRAHLNNEALDQHRRRAQRRGFRLGELPASVARFDLLHPSPRRGDK
jgi:hypothetical protein